jgi:hypothetical protein
VVVVEAGVGGGYAHRDDSHLACCKEPKFLHAGASMVVVDVRDLVG